MNSYVLQSFFLFSMNINFFPLVATLCHAHQIPYLAWCYDSPLEELPCVFRYSKLNLNPTLKSIQSGIPLRALDIMGAKGVLLSNFQPELVEYFEDGLHLS